MRGGRRRVSGSFDPRGAIDIQQGGRWFYSCKRRLSTEFDHKLEFSRAFLTYSEETSRIRTGVTLLFG